MSINKGMMSSNSAEWATPLAFYEELNKEFEFTLDPCCTTENRKCDKYYTKEDDGLSKDWSGEIVFCNPPYGRELSKWVEKCHTESLKGVTCVMLIPARTDTSYFHNYIYGKHEIRFIKGRLHFNESKQSAPFPSMVVVMRGDSDAS